ncbi:hypothetical protein T484DRAFT_1894872, partial [Baffinella frigidus]
MTDPLVQQQVKPPLGGGDSRLNSRRVPDFTRLHALEDARVARWKRQHKKVVTVPLGFRLTPVPSDGATAEGDASAKDASVAALSRSLLGKSEPANDHKENTPDSSRQGTPGRAGPPSSAMIYPTAFAPRGAKPGGATSNADEQEPAGRAQDGRARDAAQARKPQPQEQERRRRPATADSPAGGRSGGGESGGRERRGTREGGGDGEER